MKIEIVEGHGQTYNLYNLVNNRIEGYIRYTGTGWEWYIYPITGVNGRSVHIANGSSDYNSKEQAIKAAMTALKNRGNKVYVWNNNIYSTDYPEKVIGFIDNNYRVNIFYPDEKPLSNGPFESEKAALKWFTSITGHDELVIYPQKDGTILWK
jgi:hypothetical protein